MLFLSRLFSSQTSRLLRSLPRTPPPRPQLTTRFTSSPFSRTLHSGMPALANVLSKNAKPSETHGNFDLVKRFKLDFADVHVSKWKSRTSGLSVVHLDYEGVSIILIYRGMELRSWYSSPRQWLFRRWNRKYVHMFSELTGRSLTRTTVFDDSGCPHTLEQWVSSVFFSPVHD